MIVTKLKLVNDKDRLTRIVLIILRFYNFAGNVDSLRAELLGIKHDLTHAWRRGYRDVICELDSMEVVRLVSSMEHAGYHTCGALNVDIVTLTSQ